MYRLYQSYMHISDTVFVDEQLQYYLETLATTMALNQTDV